MFAGVKAIEGVASTRAEETGGVPEPVVDGAEEYVELQAETIEMIARGPMMLRNRSELLHGLSAAV
jgi:hypothetical protein